MKDSTPSSETLARLLAAPVAAFAAAVLTWFLLICLSWPFDHHDSESVVSYGLGLAVDFGAGFAFVFVGSLVAGRRGPVITPLCFVALGIACFTYLHTQYSSSEPFPVWLLVASITGGLCAVGVRAIKRQRSLRIGVVVFGVFLLLIVVGAWLSWRFELRRLRAPESVVQETGLRLPEHTRITATRAHLFSLADGENYEWLVQSDTSLLPWVKTNMKVETGGWERVRLLSELGFSEEMPRDTRFGGVWKAYRRTSRGLDEESYLSLSEDGKVGILETFRP
jgi:hypothetical protein